MKKLFKLLAALIFFIIVHSSRAQNNIELTGHLNDSLSREPLVGATVTIEELTIGTVTDPNGMFTITVPKGEYHITIDYLGYKSVRRKIEAHTSRSMHFVMQSQKELLREVEVSTEAKDRNVYSNEMSVTKLSMKDVKQIPALLGEVDVIRSIQLTPGVSTVGEDATGFKVRGDSRDQNLILMDEAPVYNSSHLFGFFTIFDPDAVKDVRLYQGGIPARYG